MQESVLVKVTYELYSCGSVIKCKQLDKISFCLVIVGVKWQRGVPNAILVFDKTIRTEFLATMERRT